MAKITWAFQDEKGTNLNRYIATNVATGEEITFDLLRGGNISVVGTPLNAKTLNSLIDAINELYDKDSDINDKITNINTEITNLKNTDIDFEDRLEILEGNHLYEHNITLNGTYYATTILISIRIINNSANKITKDTIENYYPKEDGDTIEVSGLLVGSDAWAITNIEKSSGAYYIVTTNKTNTRNPLAGFSETIKDSIRQIY